MESTIKLSNEEVLNACRQQLNRFFASYPDPALEKRAMKALRFMETAEKPLAGKTEGWSAGLVYAIANMDRQACGVPGILNSEFMAFFGVSMETVRKRAAHIARQLTI